MIDIRDYSLIIRETVSSKKEQKETSREENAVRDAKGSLLHISDWYDERLSVEQNF